tara:strand:- start:60654 stop:61295 length:642 start_codon:yes stop_codon:yes gene_type:complete
LKNKYVKYLRDKTKKESFVDRLKIVFRPLIFPLESLLSKIEDGDRVFDIGCGSGQFLLLVAEFKKPAKVSGIEINDRLINNAKNLFSNYQKDTDFSFSTYDGEDFPSEIKEYNKIYLNDVFHHVPKKLQIRFLETIYNSLSKGSVFVLKDINKSSPLVYFNKLHDIIFAGEIGNEMKYNDAYYLLKNLGFEIVSTHKERIFLYPHYIITCKKV